MAIQYKRGYSPNTRQTFSSPHLKRTWGIKVPVEEEPNQPPLTVCFRSPPCFTVVVERVAAMKALITSLLYRCCWEGCCHESFIQVFPITKFLISLINQTCRWSIHNHVHVLFCFRYWFMILNMFYEICFN